jgi:hypothetical protein
MNIHQERWGEAGSHINDDSPQRLITLLYNKQSSYPVFQNRKP